MTNVLSDLELTGRTRTHVVQVDDLRCALHRDVLDPFLALAAAAAEDGIDLKVFSAFRDFCGPALDLEPQVQRPARRCSARDGGVLEHAALGIGRVARGDPQLVGAPGASRHHWGSDIDVFDAAAIAPDYRVQLLPEEFAEGGPFCAPGPLARRTRSAVRVFPAVRPRARWRVPGALAYQPRSRSPCPPSLA